jgi:hypothetical protein
VYFPSHACLYVEASKDYKLIIMQFSDPFLWSISTSTISTTLNSSYISKFRIVISVIVNIYKLFINKVVGMFLTSSFKMRDLRFSRL